ncbi:hypothetical protein CERSUDRAFT_92257 [Gelatoporia subvermispora B]|uniref:F-box domain-containing protein n=1 Tax=Ceriporiopsis subvermispora (strain B) TaxID=914234 RepID=M2R5B0_CERS8|nr:hypothetical protein CERSUDRAFT_92257 [Gelatoporia subvermispora B]
MAANHLPPEVCELIIDKLSGDLQALRTCSLLGRKWLPRSRYWLFRRRINVTSSIKKRQLEDLIMKNPQTFGQYIVFLRIECRKHSDLDLPALAQMPYLEELDLCGAHWRDEAIFRQSAQHLRTLRLVDCQPTWDGLCRGLENIPQLEELIVLEGKPLFMTDISEPLRHDALPHLHTLVLDHADTPMIPHIASALFSHRGTAGLRVLNVGSATPAPARNSIWWWFDDAAPTLQYLGFTVKYRLTAADLHLERCTCLYQLDLCVSEIATAQEVLAHIAAPRLMEVRFATQVISPRPHWTALATVLSMPVFGALKHVEIRLDLRMQPDPSADLADVIRRSLLEIEKHWTLKITFGVCNHLQTMPRIRKRKQQ